MNNNPYEPGQQPPYGPYQAGGPYVPPPPPPPPSYSSPGISGPYQTTDQYLPTLPMNPYVPPGPPPERPKKMPLVAIIVVVVLLIIAAGTVGVIVVSKTTGTVTPPTPTPVPYPSMASAYSGLAHNITYNEDGEMAMTGVTQDGGKINGAVRFGLPLVGDSTFSGIVSRTGAIQFTIVSSDAGGVTSTFVGQVDKQGSMSGTYTINNGQKGTWKASPAASPVIYPLLFANYSGNFDNTATGKTGTMTLKIITQSQQNFTGMFDSSISVNGTVGTDNTIQFTGADSNGGPVVFNGTVNIDGTLNGTYKASSGGAGTWKVTPK